MSPGPRGERENGAGGEAGGRERIRSELGFSTEIRRGLRVHGALDLGAAALYAWLGFGIAPGRVGWWNGALAILIALLVAAGVGLLAGLRPGRWVALVAQLSLLGFCLTTVALLVASAAYLRGVYGAVGQGMAYVTLLIAALTVETCGLLPFFQLRFLLRDDVRDQFGSSGGGPGTPVSAAATDPSAR